MREELKRLQAELGLTFIHVTHGQDEAMALADLMVVMNGGRIEQAGRRARCSTSRDTAFVARFIGGHNVLPADLLGLGRGEVALRADRASLRAPPATARSGSTPPCRWSSTRAPPCRSASRRPPAREVQVVLDEAAFDAAPVAAGQRVEPELAARRGARAGRLTRPTNEQARGIDDASTTIPGTRPHRRLQPARRAARDAAGHAPRPRASSFPAPFVHADDPIMLRYPGTGVNPFKEIADKCKADTGITIQYTPLTTDDVIKRAVTQPNSFDMLDTEYLLLKKIVPSGNLRGMDTKKIKHSDKIMPIFTKGELPDGKKIGDRAPRRTR